MSTKKILIVLGVVVAVLLAIAVIRGKKKSEIKVSIEKVGKGSITETVSAIGKIQPMSEVSISPDVAGEIIELHVMDGGSVTKGQLLLKINPELVKSARDQMRASLSGAKASLASSKAQLARANANFIISRTSFNRSKKLYKDKVISSQEYENSQASFTNAEAELEVAKQSVESARFTIQSSQAVLNQASENVNRTSVYAPVNGIISTLNVELGERVVGTSQMAGTEMLKIADLNNMEVQVDVSENDIVSVSLNDSVFVELDAYKDRKFKGVVTEIANSASNSISISNSAEQATNFVVKIKILRSSYEDLIEKNPHPIKPGMSASVEIITETTEDVLTLPISAITTRTLEELKSRNSKKGKKMEEIEKKKMDSKNKEQEENKESDQFVFVLDGDKVKAVKVTSGIQDSEKIQILSGLKEGEEVVVLSYLAVAKLLKDGSKVIVVDKDKLFEFKD